LRKPNPTQGTSGGPTIPNWTAVRGLAQLTELLLPLPRLLLSPIYVLSPSGRAKLLKPGPELWAII